MCDGACRCAYLAVPDSCLLSLIVLSVSCYLPASLLLSAHVVSML